MDLPAHVPSSLAQNLGKSQTTFRRTPLRVRVEDLMTVNEDLQDKKRGGAADHHNMSMSSTVDKQGSVEDHQVADSD